MSEPIVMFRDGEFSEKNLQMWFDYFKRIDGSGNHRTIDEIYRLAKLGLDAQKGIVADRNAILADTLEAMARNIRRPAIEVKVL